METLTPSRWADSFQARKPKATDDFVSQGLYRMEKPKALKKIHVAMNSEYSVGALTFDIDEDDAAELVLSLVYDEESIPKPSWITTNKASTHAHVGFLLEKPVLTMSNAHSAPLDYLADIQRTITNRIPGADRGYTAPTTRNPLVEAHHRVLWGPAKPYSLGELQEPLGKLDKPSKVITEVGYGRNVSMFNTLRDWAYKQFSKHENMATFEKAIRAQARALNPTSFDAPLSQNELNSIVRSVTMWIWRKFNTPESKARLSEKQRNIAMKRAAYVSKQDALKEVRKDAENGIVPPAQEIADRYGVSIRTAYSYLEELGLTEKRSIESRIPEVMALKSQRFTNVVIADMLGLTPRQVGYAIKKGKEAIG